MSSLAPQPHRVRRGRGNGGRTGDLVAPLLGFKTIFHNFWHSRGGSATDLEPHICWPLGEAYRQTPVSSVGIGWDRPQRTAISHVLSRARNWKVCSPAAGFQ